MRPTVSTSAVRRAPRWAAMILATVGALVLSLAAALPADAVGSAATTIDARASKQSIFNSQTVVVQFDLASEGEPIAGAPVEVRYAGRSTMVAADENGHGSVPISDLPVGQAAVILRFAGDTAHAATSTRLAFSVSPRPTKIAGLTASSTVDSNMLIRYVVTSNGKLLPRAKTAITYDGATVWATTGPDGRVAVTLKRRPAASPTVLVRYFGDVVNGRASATTSVTVPNPCPVTAKACIDLANNVTWLQSGGAITYGPVPMTSGRPGYRTRPGMFQVYWKHKDHISSIYRAPMPNSIFFDGGIAFHVGSLSVASHGCIHLSRAASDVFWASLRNGDKVYVWGTAKY